MTYYLLIALCIIILISYVFELTSRFTKIPGVLLLILLGIIVNQLLAYLKITIPDLSNLLPMMGTLGLILIVLEGSLDLTISKGKKKLITNSISSAFFLFLIFEIIFTSVLVLFYNIPTRTAVINTIPLGIISSAVAIPSVSGLSKTEKEFVIYESSFSDIIGILAFDFILYKYSSIGKGIMGFIAEMILTIIISIILSTGLAYILHKISHHIKYVIITAVIVLVYSLAKLAHMPSLLVVLIFGLVMNNNHLFKNKFSLKVIDFNGFNSELSSFKHITGELTFIIRSFFFIMFGYYTSVLNLIKPDNLIWALIISLSIFVIRAIYFRIVLKIPLNPLLFFAPRGLITILLFLSIPASMQLGFINKALITQVIFITILMMAFGNIFFRKVGINLSAPGELKLDEQAADTL